LRQLTILSNIRQLYTPIQPTIKQSADNVTDVDKVYNDLKKKGIDLKIDLRNEPWVDRHFAIQDPNGIGIDIVKYLPQQKE
jgi:uncharacterized glyoxalase superfamily protein PhnB